MLILKEYLMLRQSLESNAPEYGAQIPKTVGGQRVGCFGGYPRRRLARRRYIVAVGASAHPVPLFSLGVAYSGGGYVRFWELKVRT